MMEIREKEEGTEDDNVFVFSCEGRWTVFVGH